MTNREDIVSRYRDRITTGKRTKLTSAEQTQMIEAFIDHLGKLTTDDEIKARCGVEMALLEEGYDKATIAKDRLRYYRTAIKTAMVDSKLPMTAETSRAYTYTTRSGQTQKAHDHRALDYLKYDAATYRTIATQSAQNNNEKQDHLKPVSLSEILTKATELLQSNDPFEMAVGIAAITGRRFSEVVDKGTIELTDQLYWVQFSGQTKKKSEADSYLTPCLVPAADVVAALDRFRSHPRIARIAGTSAKTINASLANSAKRVVDRCFRATGIIPVLNGEAGVSVHNLRGMYGEICIHYFCPPDRGVARFLQERLGHTISSEELKRGNSSATQHYFHYFLVDENGKHIGAKGVMLSGEKGEALPTQIETNEEIQPEPETLAIATEPRIDQQDSTSAIAALSEQVAILKKEISNIWNHIMNTQSPQAPITVENLRAQLIAMEQHRDQMAAQLEQVKTENEDLQRQLLETRQVYQQRVEALTDLLKQAPITAQISQPVESIPERTAVAPAPKTQTPMATTRQHITTAGSADQRVEGAMRALMQWNREHDSDSAKFAITQSLLQKTTGSNMGAVKRVMESFKNEIYEHNSEYGLDPDRHNYGKDLSEIKAFVQGKV